ncbi:MAG: glycosyltransferase [Endomicrobiaceae bacterium]|nr:glycosyltransferase [Endomicrobiaceae bacterium]
MNLINSLQVFLITYNRKKYLQRTFDQIFADNSPIKELDITILNNKSDDGTSELIEQYRQKFPNIKHIIHNHNIGGNANIVRAFEYAIKEYVWVLCDDDIYDWTNWKEVESAIYRQEDIICVSKYAIDDDVSIESQILQLTFVPAGIFKTSTLNKGIIRSMYDQIYAFFPHLVPTIFTINNKNRICVLDRAVVYNGMELKNTDCSYTRGSNLECLSDRTKAMSWIVAYANLCSMIKDIKLKHKAIYKAIKYIHGNFRQFSKDMVYLYLDEQNWMHFWDIYWQLDTKNRFKLLTFFIFKMLFSMHAAHNNFFIIRIFGIKVKFKKNEDDNFKIINCFGIKIKKNKKSGKIFLQ